jgi:hypothetical protein
MGNEGTGFPGQIQARKPTTKDPLDLYADEDSGALYAAGWVWNSVEAAWEKRFQGAANDYFKDVLREYNSTTLLLTYEGFNKVHQRATSSATWYVWKYTWDINGNNTRVEGPLYIAWDERANAANWA